MVGHFTVYKFCFLYAILKATELPGCSDNNGYELVANAVYACRGVFNQGNTSDGGIFGPSAAAICGDLYEVCGSYPQASSLGLTQSLCGDTNGILSSWIPLW